MYKKIVVLFLILLLFYVNYNFSNKVEKFKEISQQELALQVFLEQTFGISEERHYRNYDMINLQEPEQEYLSVDINQQNYKKYTLNFTKRIKMHQRYLHQNADDPLAQRMGDNDYTQSERNNIINKFLLVNIADSFQVIVNSLTYCSPFYINKTYLDTDLSYQEDDNEFVILANEDLVFNLNRPFNNFFRDFSDRNKLLSQLDIFADQFNYIKNNYRNNINKIQGIVFDCFLINFGVLLKDSHTININDDNSVDYTINFQLDIYNKQVDNDNYKLSYNKLRTDILNNCTFVENKLLVMKEIIRKIEVTLDDGSLIHNRMNNYLNYRTQHSNEFTRYEDLRILFIGISVLFRESSDLQNALSTVLDNLDDNSAFVDYRTTKINIDNQIIAMRLRNLLVFDMIVEDFETYLEKAKFFPSVSDYSEYSDKTTPSPSDTPNPSPSGEDNSDISLNDLELNEPFTNMCNDLRLSGNVRYVDNELYNGFTCNDYARHNLCEGGRTLSNYFDQSQNLQNLTAREACCVCGGGVSNNTTPTPSPTITNSQEQETCEPPPSTTEETEFNEDEFVLKNYKKLGFGLVQFKATGVSNIISPEIHKK